MNKVKNRPAVLDRVLLAVTVTVLLSGIAVILLGVYALADLVI